ncbi:hypothetical protein LXL04_032557 [Taraxacum kok-saghyz]
MALNIRYHLVISRSKLNTQPGPRYPIEFNSQFLLPTKGLCTYKISVGSDDKQRSGTKSLSELTNVTTGHVIYRQLTPIATETVLQTEPALNHILASLDSVTTNAANLLFIGKHHPYDSNDHPKVKKLNVSNSACSDLNRSIILHQMVNNNPFIPTVNEILELYKVEDGKPKIGRLQETGKKLHTSPVVKRLTAFGGGAHWSGIGAVKNGQGNQQKKSRWYRGGIMRNFDVSRCRPQLPDNSIIIKISSFQETMEATKSHLVGCDYRGPKATRCG